MLRVTRRYFLKSGALLAYAGLAPLQGLIAGPAPQVRRGKTLVAVFLRGGVDGLNLIVPHAEQAYYDLRKTIAIPRPGAKDGALDLDGFFGLHPAADALRPLFESGTAAALQAVGYDRNTRSHFEEQDTWETGIAGNTVHSDGWLNRHLATSEGHGPIRAVSIGEVLPRILRGQAPAFALRGISDLAVPTAGGDTAAMVSALEHGYCSAPPASHLDAARSLLSSTARTTLDGANQLRGVTNTPYVSSVDYPDTNTGRRLREVARLIKANVGLEVAEVDVGGWDTHNGQGGADGAFANLTRELSQALAAFCADLESRLDDVLILTLSDFGRTAAENGTRGTDHGWANCLLALGGPIRARKQDREGRPVLGSWPGLAKDQLNEGRDLRHTTDFRDVLCEVVSGHLGNPRLSEILPQHQAKAVGLL